MMTISCKIENGIVTNRVRGPVSSDVPGTWIDSDVAQIGWAYNGQTFSPPPWDRSNAPSEWHEWQGDKETRIGTWVERTAEKTEYERKETFNDADAIEYETVRKTYTKEQIDSFVASAFPDPKQQKIIRFLVKDAVRKS